MKIIKCVKINAVSKIYVGENVSNLELNPRGDNVSCLKLMQLAMFSRLNLSNYGE